MVKSLTILGATGSIGASTLALVAENPSAFSIVALTAENNVEDLAKLALQFNAKYVVIADESKFTTLKTLLGNSKTKALAGKKALEEAASLKADLVISAITGIAGLKPTFAAIEAGNTIALANKESLVAAGTLVMQRAKEKGVTILPVDSEHNALFQALYGYTLNDVDKLILTASGGPFRTWDKAKIDKATPKEALKHPNWSMGAKVTIDSASLMNKGLELIEAHFLFDCPIEKLEVIVHPQSVIHGIVAYKDGSFIAQMGASDMRIPISSCLNYPLRAKSNIEKLDLVKLSKLTFEAPDRERFPCLALAETALKEKGALPLILNAANESAVAAFLNGDISFGEIAIRVENAVNKFAHFKQATSIEEVFEQNDEVRLRLLAKKS